MKQKNRLQSGGRINRSRPLTFTYNGDTYYGYEGDTVASALLANGVDIIARSFKYSRPRGLVAAGAEEPNGVLQIGSKPDTQVPNVRATQQWLYDGLTCNPTNGWPSVNNDFMSFAGKIGGRMMPPGFYYKTFMYPASMWETYEKYIRKAAGLGKAPTERDPDVYDKVNQHCDVLVVGAGAAGLMAALTAARGGARVILADEQAEFGGSLLDQRVEMNGRPAADWVSDVEHQLSAFDDVTLLKRATVTGYHDHNFLTIHEQLTDHLGETAPKGQVRSRLHRVRARWVVLATGAHERPLVFGNNDLPGSMLPSAISTYINRYGVVPGDKLVIGTTNDSAYRTALDWDRSGREVVAVVDSRTNPRGDLVEQVKKRGIKVIPGSAIIDLAGKKRVSAAYVAQLNADGTALQGNVQQIACDTVGTSGGWSPVVHLSCHTGSRPVWRDDIVGFVPGAPKQQQLIAGSITGTYDLEGVLAEGGQAGRQALTEMGFALGDETPVPSVESIHEDAPMALFEVPHSKPVSRAPKKFVDLQNDVTASGIVLATQEGFEAIEHVKRYTALGFGTDQGKLGNINGMAIAAKAQGKTIPETGTTVFRPNYTPVTFGAIAGRECGHLYQPERFTAMQAWHLKQGAKFEDVGQWKRPWYYPQGNETLKQAVKRECEAVRNAVGILDASTLGKIDVQGPDAREFLGRIYTNAWAKLAVGKCRYGLMCHEDGMVFDDGVTACLGENHFLMTTTSGGAGPVLSWLEFFHQTEWPELEVYFTSVTEHWATMTLTGPNARKLLAELATDVDLDKDNFKFMDWRTAKIAGIPARIFRISYTGELTYEINVEAHYGHFLWEKLFEHGKKYGLTPYGTETMHYLRADKGFIVVGQDTDGTVTPYDLGMNWAVGKKKPFSFVGKRGLSREDNLREDRKQLVGLKTRDPNVVLPEGAQAVADPNQPIPMTLLGHVSSSYFSPTLGRSIALGFVTGGQKRMGETVYYPLVDGTVIEAEICSPVFYDPEGERQNV